MMSNTLERILYNVKKRHKKATFFSSTTKLFSNLKELNIFHSISSDIHVCLIYSNISEFGKLKRAFFEILEDRITRYPKKDSIQETIKKLHKKYVERSAECYINMDSFDIFQKAKRNRFCELNYRKSNLIEKLKKEAKTEKISTYIWLLFWLYIYSKKRVRTRRWACFQTA